MLTLEWWTLVSLGCPFDQLLEDWSAERRYLSHTRWDKLW